MAWFELEIVHHTERWTGTYLGTVLRVAYIEIRPAHRGRYPSLVRQMICDMIRHSISLAVEHSIDAIAIDPDDDAEGIKKAMSRRPEAVLMNEYPWPYLIPVRALPDLEEQYCRAPSS